MVNTEVGVGGWWFCPWLEHVIIQRVGGMTRMIPNASTGSPRPPAGSPLRQSSFHPHGSAWRPTHFDEWLLSMSRGCNISG